MSLFIRKMCGEVVMIPSFLPSSSLGALPPSDSRQNSQFLSTVRSLYPTVPVFNAQLCVRNQSLLMKHVYKAKQMWARLTNIEVLLGCTGTGLFALAQQCLMAYAIIVSLRRPWSMRLPVPALPEPKASYPLLFWNDPCIGNGTCLPFAMQQDGVENVKYLVDV